MCGLVGMVCKNRNGFTNGNMDAFDTLLFVDQMRGQDSTGVFVVDNIGNVEIAKEVGDATTFIRQPGYRAARQTALNRGWAMIGHNRKATKGTINDENAHPFWVDEKLVLVHNGTTYGNHKDLKDVEVDSHAIAHTLAEEPDIEKAMQKINAAYALIWYEVASKRLNFLRNDQRPLNWCETGDAYFFCSEVGMLEFAMNRNNIKIINGGPYGFGVYTLDTWVLNADKSTSTETKELDARYKPPMSPRAQSAANFQQEIEALEEAETLSNVIPLPSSPRSIRFYGDEDGVEVLPPEELAHLRDVGMRIAKDALERARAMPAVEPEEPKDEKFRPIGLVHPVPEWLHHNTYADWKQAHTKYTKQRIRVEVKDYLKDEAGPDKIYMTGTTLEGDDFYVVFPVAKSIFNAITDPKSDQALSGRAEFSVEIDTVGWRTVIKEGKDMDKWKGVIVLSGSSARMYSSAGRPLH